MEVFTVIRRRNPALADFLEENDIQTQLNQHPGISIFVPSPEAVQNVANVTKLSLSKLYASKAFHDILFNHFGYIERGRINSLSGKDFSFDGRILDDRPDFVAENEGGGIYFINGILATSDQAAALESKPKPRETPKKPSPVKISSPARSPPHTNLGLSLPGYDVNGSIVFDDFPDFQPNLTPKEIFQRGVYGGAYFGKYYISDYAQWNQDVGGGLNILGYPAWGIPDNLLGREVENDSLNRYKVNGGKSSEDFLYWYVNFYYGERTPEDASYVKQWLGVAGPKGRFSTRLVRLIKAKHGNDEGPEAFNDYSISPVLRQNLLQWAKEITAADLK
jgi:hypothetical protein